MNVPTEYLPVEDEATPEPEPTTALAVIPASPNPLAARDAGIASYLSSAYARAGNLRLTPEETKILKSDFPDDAFLTGAAGKDNLIYINPRCLRDRMDEGLGMGGWSLVALRTWNEEYKTTTATAVRVYHECILIVRGVYICQAVGDMSYYLNNATQNYGDAYQGSQSHSLRRCLKDFGVGLQAWSKTFQLGWFQRQSQRLRGGGSPPPSVNPPPAAPPGPPAPPPPVSPKAKAKKAPPTMANSSMRARFLEVLGCQEDGPEKDLLKKFLVALGWLPTDKEVEQLHYRFVPLNREEMELFKVHFGTFKLDADTPGYKAVPPYAPHGLDPETLQAHPVDPPADLPTTAHAAPNAIAEPEWKKFIMPFGKKRVALGLLTPEELAFYVDQFQVRETMDVKQADGSTAPEPLSAESIASQRALRAALDQAKQPKG